MFTDPMTITINAIAKTLNRTGSGADTSSYATGTRDFRVTIGHTYGRRTRRVIKLVHDTLTANPLVTGQYVSGSVSVHLVVDAPAGYDSTLLKQDVDGFLAYLTASSGANVGKLLGGES